MKNAKAKHEPTDRGGAVLRPAAEELYADELEALAKADKDPRPPGWKLSPRAVRNFICGSEKPKITRKFYGDDTLVERSAIGLASNRGLLLVGEPGTAKSMLSELLCRGDLGNLDQCHPGNRRHHRRQHQIFVELCAFCSPKGRACSALVASPLYVGIRDGVLVRFEEITRCPPEIQDSLVSVLSEKVMMVPELDGADRVLHARPGFNVIATANIRDRGVNEMSSALKRRFNFETVHPIRELGLEVELVIRECERLLVQSNVELSVDRSVVELLVTAFQDLREGKTAEGIPVEKPTTVMSTAEAVSVAMSAGLDAFYYGERKLSAEHIARHLAGAVLKDNPDDLSKLKHYFDVVVRQRGKQKGGPWSDLLNARKWLP